MRVDAPRVQVTKDFVYEYTWMLLHYIDIGHFVSVYDINLSDQTTGTRYQVRFQSQTRILTLTLTFIGSTEWMSRFNPDSVVCFLATDTNQGEHLQHTDSLFGRSRDTFYINSVSGVYVNEVF